MPPPIHRRNDLDRKQDFVTVLGVPGRQSVEQRRSPRKPIRPTAMRRTGDDGILLKPDESRRGPAGSAGPRKR
jgi:hypothetical protein